MTWKRIKFKRTTPKTSTEYTQVNFVLDGGFSRLLKTLARVIEKHFGLLYLSKSLNVLI